MSEFVEFEDEFFDVGNEDEDNEDSNSETDSHDLALEMRPSKVFSDTDLNEHQQCLRKLYGMRRNILNTQNEHDSTIYMPMATKTENQDGYQSRFSIHNQTLLLSSSTDSDETSETSESNGSDLFDLDLLVEKLSNDSRWYEIFFHKNGLKLKEFGAEERVRNLIMNLLEVNSIISSPLPNVENTNPDEICTITHSEPAPAKIEVSCSSKSVFEDECKVEHVSTCTMSDLAPDIIKSVPCMDMAASHGSPDVMLRTRSVRSLANSNSIVKTDSYPQLQIQVPANGNTGVYKAAETTDTARLTEAPSIKEDLTKTGLSRRKTSSRSSFRSSRSKAQNSTPRKSIWGSTLIAPLQFDVSSGEQYAKLKNQKSRKNKKKLLQRSFHGTPAKTSNSLSLFRCTRSLAKLLFRRGTDDDNPTTEWKSFAYFRVSCLLMLALMDIITALTVQIFWLDSDFMCTSVALNVSTFSNQTQYGGVNVLSKGPSPRINIIVLFCFIISLHLIRMGSQMARTDSLGQVVGLRYFYCWRTAGGLSELAVNLWTALIVFLSILLVWLNYAFCMSEWGDWDPEFGRRDLSWQYRLTKRLHLVVHFIRCVHSFRDCLHLKGDLKRGLQTAVSQNKRRFIDTEAKFDLDLTYICDRMIAMALPCVDGAMYRNDIREVARFFSTRHYGSNTACLRSEQVVVDILIQSSIQTMIRHTRSHYISIPERDNTDHEEGGNGNYDPTLLYNQVQKLPCKDHNAPALSTLILFCEQAAEWLNAHSSNITAVHCQGGKGRTGTFCSALILWTELCENASEAMTIFAERRTDPRRDQDNLQGVSSPAQVAELQLDIEYVDGSLKSLAQIRVLHYLDRVLHENIDYVSPRHIMLSKVVMKSMPLRNRSCCYLTLVVESNGFIDYDYGKAGGIMKLERIHPDSDEFEFELGSPGIAVKGDVSVRFFYFDEKPELSAKSQAELGPGGRTIKYGNSTGNMLCFVSFHTAFHIGNITFCRKEIDGVYNKKLSLFGSKFAIDIHVADQEADSDRAYLPAVLESESSVLGRMTAGMPPSLRFIRLQAAFESLMERLCPTIAIYAQGEMIYDPDEVESRVLLYVVSGNAEVVFNSKNGGTDIKPARILIGKGDCFGERNFLLGVEREDSATFLLKALENRPQTTGPALRAYTPEVKIRVLDVQGMYGPISGNIPGLSVADSAIVFEFLAKTLTTRAKDAMITAKLAKSNAENIKHDKKITFTQDRHAETIKTLVRQYKIPISDALLFHENATMVSRLLGNVHSTGVKGTVFVFSTLLIFKSKGGMFPIFGLKNADFVIPLKAIEKSSVRDCVVSLIVNLVTESSMSLKQPILPCLFNIFYFWKSAPKTSSSRLEIDFILDESPDSSYFNKILNEKFEDLKGNRMNAKSFQGYKPSFLMPPSKESVKRTNMEEDEALALRKLFAQAQIVRFKPGDTILQIGAIERRLFCVWSGVVACKSSDGKVLVKLGPGDLVGEVSFLELGNQGALSQVVAETDVECASLFYQTIDLLVNFDKQVGAFFFRNLALSSCFRLQQQYQVIMNAQGQRKRRQLFQRNHTRNNVKIAFDLSNNVQCERVASASSKNLAELEQIAQRALLKWQKKLLHSAFLAWGIVHSSDDTSSRAESAEN